MGQLFHKTVLRKTFVRGAKCSSLFFRMNYCVNCIKSAYKITILVPSFYALLKLSEQYTSRVFPYAYIGSRKVQRQMRE